MADPKPNFTNKTTEKLPKKKEGISEKQLENIKEVFRLNPQLKETVYKSLNLHSSLDTYVIELRGQVRSRLRKSGVPEEEMSKLTKEQADVKQNPEIILDLLNESDITNLISSYEDNKKKQLEEYEQYKDKYKEDAEIVPEIGASISRDTSWWDIKINELKLNLEQEQKAIEFYNTYLETIFPEGKVYYRGDTVGLDKFRYSESTQQIGGVKIGNKNKFGSGIYMTTNKDLVTEFATQNEGTIYPVFVDTSKTLSFKDRTHFLSEVAKFYNKENSPNGKEVDHYTKLQQSQGFNIHIKDSSGSDELVVGSAEKYMILGSKVDIEQFKNWAEKQHEEK